jgi:ribonuclease HI
LVTDKKAVANLLASTIAHSSSTEHYSPFFQRGKEKRESRICDFKSDNSENYNTLFTLSELQQALQKCNDSAAGLDTIHYQLLTHLPEKSLLVLLNAFNHIWITGLFPPSWRQAVIVPIPKPGKDPSDPGNYRPIALTSCLCKTMERLVNARLVWHLESQGLITDLQCGFRQFRSTTDHLVRFESFIRDAFINKQHVYAIFFDLEKAYDTTWKYGIMSDLLNMGFKGHLPIFIQNFLSNRSFHVRVGSTLSDSFEQEMGVPQGSILSPVLFSIKINNIVKAVKDDSECSLFVDDFALCARGRGLASLERRLQLCVDRIQGWVSLNGFKFSPSKTVCVHFTNQTKFFPEPSLSIAGVPIKVAEEAKFLGVIFDKRLTFRNHINYLRTSCQKALDVLRVVGRTDWGADRIVLLRLYRALVRSKLDYGSVVYGSASKSVLQRLNTIHHQGLRICLGAFRTSPVPSLYAEAGEPSLKLRRIRLMLSYVLKLKAHPDNPAYDCVFKPPFAEIYDTHPGAVRPLSFRVRPHLQAAGLDLDSVSESLQHITPPWLLPVPDVLLDLTAHKKDSTPPAIYQQSLNELLSSFPGYCRIYTDGSKSEDGRVAAAAVSSRHPRRSFKHRLPDHSSVFSAELQAVLLALRHAYRSRERNFLILSDSLSALQALQGAGTDHPLLVQIRELYADLMKEYYDIIFIWVPGHVGIEGNRIADSAANDARRDPVPDTQTVYSFFKLD